MHALIEEAVFRSGFYSKPGLVAKSTRVTWAVGGHVATFTPLVMPKIKTTRTKKAPEGFEEIEPVGIVYCT